MRLDVDWEAGIDWNALREYRIGRLTQYMETKGIDALMFTKLDTVRYVTSFRPVYSWLFHGTRYVAILRKDGHIKFLVASGDYDRVKDGMPWIRDAVPFPFLISEGAPIIIKALEDLGLTEGRVGLDIIPYSVYEYVTEKLPRVKFVDGTGAIDFAQAVKCPEEIKILRQTAAVVDIGMQAALDATREGVKEYEVARAAVSAIMSQGVEDVPYFPLVVSGEHNSKGYRFPTDKIIRRGEMVYIDCGCAVINGYHGDIGRVATVGEPTAEQRKVYRIIYDMLQTGISKLLPGTPTDEVVAAVDEVAQKSGYGEFAFFGILGHGIGTDLHCAPTIGEKVIKAKREIDTIQASMVIALEPGLLVPGVGGGHLEDMVLVTEKGPEILTKTSFDARMLD
ncbi:MAG TPA: aminopeptidase P family protein [Clostridia bacterium]|nr:aminopeptidase P family protein [Clostridia bacterium]